MAPCALLLLVAGWIVLTRGDCMTMHPVDTGLCYPYLSYSQVYVSPNSVASTNIATMMQSYLTTFIDPTSSYRKQFFYFSCAMLFPKCDEASGLPLFICPDDCAARIPTHLCGGIVPVAPSGKPCTPLGGAWAAPLRASLVLVALLLLGACQ